MGMAFKLLLGFSPVLALILYFVLDQQNKQDANIAVEKEDMVINIAKFNESFEQSEMEFADTNKSKIYHLKKRDEHIKEVKTILKKREEKIKRAEELRKNSEKGFAEMEATLDNFDDSIKDDDLNLDNVEDSLDF